MVRLVALGLLCFAVAINATPPPEHPATNFADEARRLVSQADSVDARTFLKRKSFSGPLTLMFPTAANRTVAASSNGDVFFFMKGQDLAAMDKKKDTSFSLVFIFSDVRKGGCNSKNVQCPKTYIIGNVNKLDEKSDKYAFGLETFVSRHPTATNWRTVQLYGHELTGKKLPRSSLIADKFYLCKLDILNVAVFSEKEHKWITPAEYYAGTDSVDVHEAQDFEAMDSFFFY